MCLAQPNLDLSPWHWAHCHLERNWNLISREEQERQQMKRCLSAKSGISCFCPFLLTLLSHHLPVGALQSLPVVLCPFTSLISCLLHTAAQVGLLELDHTVFSLVRSCAGSLSPVGPSARHWRPSPAWPQLPAQLCRHRTPAIVDRGPIVRPQNRSICCSLCLVDSRSL